jgi:hypothetical protein
VPNKNPNTLNPSPLIIRFDICEINSGSDRDAHIESCALPAEVDVTVCALLPELPDELPHVVVEKHHASVLPVLGDRSRNCEVSPARVPFAFLNYQLRIDYLRRNVLVVFHQLDFTVLKCQNQT